MKRNTFEEFEIPYSTPRKFGLISRDGEDPPEVRTSTTSAMEPTPGLIIRIKDDDGNTHWKQGSLRITLAGENGNVDVVLSQAEVCPTRTVRCQSAGIAQRRQVSHGWRDLSIRWNHQSLCTDWYWDQSGHGSSNSCYRSQHAGS